MIDDFLKVWVLFLCVLLFLNCARASRHQSQKKHILKEELNIWEIPFFLYSLSCPEFNMNCVFVQMKQTR